MSMLLHRREVVKALLAERRDALVVAGLGSTAWDCTAAGDSPLTFPLWGAMGAAAMVGLGLAIAQPARRVLVVTGDGEMLMGLGSLATITGETMISCGRATTTQRLSWLRCNTSLNSKRAGASTQPS